MTLQQVLGNVVIPGLGGYLTYLIATCKSYERCELGLGLTCFCQLRPGAAFGVVQ